MTQERVNPEAMLEAALEDLEAAEAYGDALEAAVRNRHRAVATVLDLTTALPQTLALTSGDPTRRATYAGQVFDELESRAGEVAAFVACFASRPPDDPATDLVAAVAGLGVPFSPPRGEARLPVALDAGAAARLALELVALAAPDASRRLHLRRHRGLALLRVRGNPAAPGVKPALMSEELLRAGRGLILPGRAPDVVADCWLPLTGQSRQAAAQHDPLPGPAPAGPVPLPRRLPRGGTGAGRILKFALASGVDVTEVTTASPPVWLSAAWQGERLVVWAEAVQGTGCTNELQAVGTGAPAPEGWGYVATAQHPTALGGSPLVVHVYARTDGAPRRAAPPLDTATRRGARAPTGPQASPIRVGWVEADEAGKALAREVGHRTGCDVQILPSNGALLAADEVGPFSAAIVRVHDKLQADDVAARLRGRAPRLGVALSRNCDHPEHRADPSAFDRVFPLPFDVAASVEWLAGLEDPQESTGQDDRDPTAQRGDGTSGA